MSGSTDVHFGQMVFLVGQCPMSDTFLQPYTGFYMKSNTELKWVNHISKVRQMLNVKEIKTRSIGVTLFP